MIKEFSEPITPVWYGPIDWKLNLKEPNHKFGRRYDACN
jgi:hypothetical protein